MKVNAEQYFRIILIFLIMIFLYACGRNGPQESEWKPVENVMLTRWAADIDPENVLAEYPRPQMVRSEWKNLNGLWDFTLVSKDIKQIDSYNAKILVPFPVESALSGLKRTVTKDDKVWYRRYITIPNNWAGKKVLLHFGAVDWETTVFINGKEVGTHRGGYDAFTFDITDELIESEKQEIVVSVWDPTDDGHQPKGKQTTETHGFWYTAVTGIWQTVWLEPVEKVQGYIESIKLIPDIDKSTITLSAKVAGLTESHRLKFTASEGDKVVGLFTGLPNEDISLKLLDKKLWSPENPFLYKAEIELFFKDEVIDKIDSYFGMRKISKKKDKQGVLRLALNNEIYFQFGMLDQGWWPGGLYRAPSDEAIRYDVEVTKKLGFNMLRKHGKMEPARWYYWCDKLGVLIWQDMTPGDIEGEYGTDRTEESAKQFEFEYGEMVDELYNHPSVVIWVIFNEGWGQYDTERLVAWTKNQDPTRLVVGASGFVDKGVGDMHDVHGYPGPTGVALEDNRVTTLDEFGGLGFPVKGHLWDESKAWGYVNYKNVKELEDAYESLINKLHPYVSEGVSSAIYTQITDVENEVNGMMTYDRSVIKMDQKRVRNIADQLYAVKPGFFNVNEVIPTSQKSGQEWRYVSQIPADGWEKQKYDDKDWKIGEGGFGDPKDSNPVIRTEWKDRELWLRKSFTYDGEMNEPLYIQIYHQFESETHIYLNGDLIAEGPEHSNAYTFIKLDDKAKSLLKSGENILAVYCKNNGRRAYFDAGLVVFNY
jgi:beta-galactosidase/beta-glucuronidase